MIIYLLARYERRLAAKEMELQEQRNLGKLLIILFNKHS